MECDCNALEIVIERGGEYVEKLLELFYSLKLGYYKTCFRHCKKPCPRWIWSDLEIRDALAIVAKDGKYFEPRPSADDSSFCNKPSSIWIWSDLAKVALMKGFANTDVLKFIESKKRSKYGVSCLEASAEEGRLDSIQYIVDYGFDPTSNQDCNWGDYETFGSLVINMWEKVLKKAVDAGHDSGELFEYLELMVKISEVDADIAFIKGDVISVPGKSGVSELKKILDEKRASIPGILRKKRERYDCKKLERTLAYEFGEDYHGESDDEDEDEDEEDEEEEEE